MAAMAINAIRTARFCQPRMLAARPAATAWSRAAIARPIHSAAVMRAP
jgi:hypothetical protein